jgi:asparagine synthase (glutamine-hydrolysing)
MCGINGLHIDNKSNNEIYSLLKKMNQKIIHRGPDEEGYFFEDNIGMSMTRLSIIDLTTGTQPIYNDDENLVIVFNGEIYNYISLRNHLKESGVRFKTTSDTEVVLKLYEKYGTDSFKMLDGMFAFSIFDKNKQQVIIARDFFGEKPLYYTRNEGGFYWGSELKSIITVINEPKKISIKGLNLFFRLTYIPAPYTIYQNIYKLEANHYLTYDINSASYKINNIHQEKYPAEKIDASFETAKNNIYNLVNQSVESRSVADVEIGTFLSGGVDSSIVSLLLAQQNEKPINTFSIGFKKKSFDETDKSRIVAKLINSNHREFIIDESDLENNLTEILLNFDEPFADSSALASYIVANKTSNHLKVALTGDGGDEVFGGYNKYYIGKINQKYTRIIPKFLHHFIKNSYQNIFKLREDSRGLQFKINKLLNAIDYDDNYYWNIISLGFQKESIKNILLPDFQENGIFAEYKEKANITHISSLTDFRLIDKLVSLEGDMLVKVDRTAMFTSLETRAPFLNKEIWDYTMSLPESYLLNGNNKKYILKEAFKKYFPDGFLEKSKMGFGVPVGDWLRTNLKNELVSYIDPNFLNKQNIFHQGNITKLVENHLSKKNDNSFKVWTYFVFQKWYKNNF